jgi:hypothetical protein
MQNTPSVDSEQAPSPLPLETEKPTNTLEQVREAIQNVEKLAQVVKSERMSGNMFFNIRF